MSLMSPAFAKARGTKMNRLGNCIICLNMNRELAYLKQRYMFSERNIVMCVHLLGFIYCIVDCR